MSTMRLVSTTALCIVLSLSAGAMDIGKPSPAFTIQRLDGTPMPLTQFRGKVVALAFIDTECPHCQHLTGLLNVIAKEYEAKGVQVVECAFNDGAQGRLPFFIQQFQPKFPIGYSPRDPVITYLAHPILKPLYVPHMVFLDRKGVVRMDVPGEDPFMTDPDRNIRAKLDELLKPATTSSAKQTKATASVAPSHP